MGRYVLLLLLLAAATLSGCGLANDEVQSGAQAGMRLPDTEFTRLDGAKIKLSALRGKPVVINFWATWCGPCLEEIPLLQAAYANTQGQRFELIAITEESQATVSAFATANALQLPIALDPNGHAMQRYHVQGIPTTFFLDSAGLVVVRHTGTLTPAMFEAFLAQISPAEPSISATPNDNLVRQH